MWTCLGKEYLPVLSETPSPPSPCKSSHHTLLSCHSSHLWLRMYVMMVEKRQSSSRAVQGYTTGCSPAPEAPTSLGKALSSWEE